MNVNLGIFPKLNGKKIKSAPSGAEAYHERAMAAMSKFIAEQGELFTVDK